jgi:hypothetical protein
MNMLKQIHAQKQPPFASKYNLVWVCWREEKFLPSTYAITIQNKFYMLNSEVDYTVYSEVLCPTDI